MDLQYFLNILWRRKWLILATTLLAATLTYFLVGRQSDSYAAEASISTGIMGGAIGTIQTDKDNPYIQDYQIKMHFDNLITNLTSRKNINFLIYKLILNDMEGSEPFRTLEDMKNRQKVNFDLTEAEIQDVLNTIAAKSDSMDFAFKHDPKMQKDFNSLAEALGYDYTNLLKYNLFLERGGDSDNVKVKFESEDPRLCTYAVNTFCDESVRFNYFLEKQSEERNFEIANAQAKEKKRELDQLTLSLKNHMEGTNIVDASGVAEALISQQKKLQQDREELRNKVPALKNNIRQLGNQITDIQLKDGNNKDAEQEVNKKLVAINELIKKTELEYSNSEMKDKSLKSRLEIYYLQRDKIMEDHANELIRKRKAVDSKSTQEELYRKKTDAELELVQIENRLQSIEQELIRLAVDQRKFVGDDATIKKIQTDIEIAKKEYEALLNEASGSKRAYESNFFPIKVLEYAQLPEKPMPKHRAVITAFAGVVGGVLSTIGILLMAFFDNSLNSPNKFQQRTDVNLMGTINKIKTKNLNLQQLFSSNGNVKNLDVFKESMRNLRFTIESSNAKKFLFTSTQKNEGKTFLIVTLAHTLMLKNKKVLLVDTNFKNNSLTKMSEKAMESNMLTTKMIGESDLSEDFTTHSMGSGTFKLENVDILGNKGSYLSPSEVFAGKDFEQFIDKLSQKYDYIFFEGAALNDFSDSKELVKYVDKVIAVFGSESELKQRDKNSISFLKSLGNKFMGAVLNKTKLQDLEG